MPDYAYSVVFSCYTTINKNKFWVKEICLSNLFELVVRGGITMRPIKARVGRSQARIHRGKKMVRQSKIVK